MWAPQPAPAVHQAVRAVEVGIVCHDHQEQAGGKIEPSILGDVHVDRQHTVQLPECNAGADGSEDGMDHIAPLIDQYLTF
jgi:hypothetical protein